MVSWKLIGLLVAAAAVATALPTEGEAPRALHTHNTIHTENDLMEMIYADCLRKDPMSCIKYKLFTFVDKVLTQKDTFSVTEGVTVVKTTNVESEGAPRTISGDESVESLILHRVQRYLNTHTLKVDLKGSDVVNAISSTGRALEDLTDNLSESNDVESRGKKKKAGKILGPLLAAIALKAAALLPLMLGGIALIAGKALLIGKIALVLSAIIGLKKLLSAGGGKHVTYEVVAHPHHSSSHVSGGHESYGGSGFAGAEVGGGGYGGSAHGGWGRSIDAQDIAYRGQQQQQPAQ